MTQGNRSGSGMVRDRRFTEEELTAAKIRRPRCTDVIRLRLELTGDDYDGSVAEALRKYGGVKYGDRISRDVLVPADLELWALHYVIQRAFGWQNSHLHCFCISTDRMKEITEGRAGEWANLCGIVFRSPLMDEDSEFWSDDYESGTFKSWLRGKYTGPYSDDNREESYWYIRKKFQEYQDLSELRNDSLKGKLRKQGMLREEKYVVKWLHYEGYPDFPGVCYPEKDRIKTDRDMAGMLESYERSGVKVVKEEILPYKDLPTEAFQMLYERPAEELLERLKIGEVLALGHLGVKESGLKSDLDGKLLENYREAMKDVDYCLGRIYEEEEEPSITCIADEVYYRYDFGDDWTVKISGSSNCRDLVEEGKVTQEDLDAANLQVQKTYRPVMIVRDGIDVADDMGGYGSIGCFLRALNGDESMDNDPYDDREETLEWAKSQGWSNGKAQLKNRL